MFCCINLALHVNFKKIQERQWDPKCVSGHKVKEPLIFSDYKSISYIKIAAALKHPSFDLPIISLSFFTWEVKLFKVYIYIQKLVRDFMELKYFCLN